jgi:ABC-type sulfate transport system substrate-binding protein
MRDNNPGGWRMSILAKRFGALVVGVGLVLGGVTGAFAETTLLNVSYDPTRELYKSITKPSRNIGRPRPAKT